MIYVPEAYYQEQAINGYTKETAPVFNAVSAYCPITDLDHADAAYEWQF